MRVERDWSATQAHEALREGLGLAPKSRAAYVAIEDGRPLKAREETFLRSYFGGGPSDEDRESQAGSGGDTPDPAALIAAIEAQTRAITAVLDRLTAADEDREARLRALEAEVRSLREQRAAEGSPARHVPAGIGE